MGTGASKLRGVSHERLLQATRQPRAFFDELFQIFLKHITPADLLALSNPDGCKKYIFIMADAIQHTFDTLKISTTKDKRGTILFQRTDELIKDSALHRDNCVAVAYFFIRLFQILGAIMLTCVDTPSASFRGVYDVRYEGTERRPGAAPGFYPIGRGGGKYTNYPFFNNVFDGSNKLTGYPAVAFSTQTEKIITDLYAFSGNKEIFRNHILKISIKNVVKESDTSYEFDIGNPDLILKSEFNAIKDNLTSLMKDIKNVLSLKSIHTTYDSTKRAWMVDSKTLHGFIHDYIVNIVKVLLGTLKVSGIEKIFSGVQNNVGHRIPGAAGVVRRNSVGSIQALSSQYIQDLLQKDAYNQVSLCVARGIQLLGVDSINQVQKIVRSDICKTKLDNSPKALPIDGQKLATYDPVRVLDQLYYDKASSSVRSTDAAKISSTIQISDQERYNEFLKTMHSLFGKLKDGDKVNKFEEITIAPKCSGTKGTPLVIQTPAKIRGLTEAVGKMFDYQTKHTQEMYNFIKTRLVLYNPTKGGISIHPSLLVGGVDALNRLGAEVREKLVKYYSFCETTYKTAAENAQKA